MTDTNDELEVTRNNARLQKRVAELEDAITERKQAEKELRESEEKVRTLYDSSSDAIMLLDEKGFFDCNDATLQLFGCASRKEFCSMHPADLSPPLQPDGTDSMVYARNNITFALKNGYKRFEHLHRRSDGTDFLAEVLLDAMVLGDRKVLQARVYDITERKKAEEQIRFLSSVVEQSADGMAIADMEGNLLFVNNAWVKMHSYEKAEELLGQNLGVFHNEEQLKNDVEPFHRKVMENGHCTGEIGHIRKDGTIFPTLMTTTIVRGKNENLIAIAGVAKDITERKKAEEELRESEEKVRTLYDSSSDAIMLLDEKSFFDCNDATLQLFGCASRKEFCSMHPADLSPPLQPNGTDSMVYARNNITFALKNGYKRFEHLHRRLDGTDFLAEVLLDAMVLGGKKVLQARVFDITERKKAEEDQEKLRIQLTQAQKMESVGRLAGGVAHDFNNMLGVILGHTEMALDEMDPAHPLHDNLMEIRTAAERSANLTRQLLAFARKQTIAPCVLDLNDIVTGMLKMLQRLIGEDLDLSWLPGLDVWPVRMDPSQIDQILANLSINARDAIEDVGKIIIETGNTILDESYCADYPGFVPGEYVVLTVSDSGCGMDKETLDMIYEPFFTTKGVGKGTGLGLATVYGIVKQNNGYINAYSEPGQGTTFRIYMPRHAAKGIQVHKKVLTEPDKRGFETILLVEDEPSILQLTTIMLEHQGYTVMVASTPGEAICLAEAYPGKIHLLITDVVMPEMNGGDLSKNLLTLYPNLRLLFMSGYTPDVIAHHGVPDEDIHFIQKPFTNQNLTAKVREVLDSE
ncbi:MAG: PAS domain S-box protein [Candidatus Aegiribacteria sp.]|nr:PAS domain S-box protein [Candidatus Aegiribacteria sp.]